MDNKAIYNEARSQITWGTPRHEVEELLESKGLMKCEINEILDQCFAERAKDIRLQGIKNIVLYSFALLACIALHIFLWYGLGYTTIKISIFILFGLIFSLFKIIDGIFYIIRGGKAMCSVNEIYE